MNDLAPLVKRVTEFLEIFDRLDYAEILVNVLEIFLYRLFPLCLLLPLILESLALQCDLILLIC